MRKSKLTTVLLSLVLSFVGLGFAGCGTTNTKISNDPKTINVRMYAAGFGSDWAYEIESKFEKAYEAEGYKVNILPPTADMRANIALQDMYTNSRNAASGKEVIDLYLTGNVTPDQVGENGEYGKLAADLRELVWNKKAVAYDGTEEDKTVGEKINPDVLPYVEDNGNMYAFVYNQSVGGLVVNTRKLKKYGLELPKTTDELFDCFDKIYCGYNGQGNMNETKTWPVTYVSGSNGYVQVAFSTWMAQYDADEYESFISMTYPDAADGHAKGDSMISDGYEVYDYASVREMVPLAYRVMDPEIAAPGTTTQTLDQAQAKIMKDANGAVFMFNGSWMLNEVKLNYRNALDDIEFINIPVISALGTKLFGEGTTLNITDEKECDGLLSYIIGLVDEGKSAAEIVSAVSSNKSKSITEDDAKEVMRARGTVYERGIEQVAFIPECSDKKEIAALFLRMMASNDFGKTFTELSNTSSPYAEQAYESRYKFVNQSVAIASNDNLSIITSMLKGFRRKVGGGAASFLYGVNHLPSAIYPQNVSMYADGEKRGTVAVYEEAASKTQADSYNGAKSRWDSLLTSAGIDH